MGKRDKGEGGGFSKADRIKRVAGENVHAASLSSTPAGGISSSYLENATKRPKNATNWSCFPSAGLFADREQIIR